MFAERSAPVFRTMLRLTTRLRRAGIPYALAGSFAVNAHGARRLSDDLDVILTPEGLQRFRERFAGSAYEQAPKRSRRFTDRANHVRFEVRMTGHYPGRDGPAPVAFPDPAEASEEIGQIRVVKLVPLIQLKLASGRYFDLAEVVSLISAHDLDESLADSLHPALRPAYLECLNEKQREDEFEARS
jgi:hypothetical protein